jgi:large repetitive protein
MALGTLANADGSESASFSLTGAGDVTGSASGPSVTYTGILPDTDLTQTGTATGMSESLTLNSASAAASWVLPLTLKGLTASLDGGSVDLTDSAGNVVWVIGPAAVSSGTATASVPGSQAPSQPAWQLVTSGGSPAVEMTLDSSWLDAPGRAFPVTASWSVSAATPGSTYAESENGTAETADNGGSALLPSGTTTNSDGTSKNIDFLSFPPLGGWPTGEHVVAASLNLFDVYAAQCSAATSVSAYQVTGSRPGRGPLTYPGPSYGTQDAQWTGTAPSAACSNTTGDPGQGGWISLQFGNAGLSQLSSGATGTAFAGTPSQTDARSFKQFASANAARAPASSSTASVPASAEPYQEVTATTETPPHINSQ